MGWGFKKRGETRYILPTQFISLSKPERREEATLSVAETPGSSLGEEGGGESKGAGGSVSLERRGEAVGLAGRMGKTEGAKGTAGQRQGGGKEEAYSIT